MVKPPAPRTFSKSITRMTIDDAGHISPERRAQIIAQYAEHEVDARVRGIPIMGEGLVFPISQSKIEIDDFAIPAHWRRIGGIDFGWTHPTAAVELAIDPDTDVIYVTKAYSRKEATPLEHAVALVPWGGYPWAWPMDGLQRDKQGGKTMKAAYSETRMRMMQVHATFPDGGNSVEAGNMQILQRMHSKRWRVFKSCMAYFDEMRMYHRKDGVIVKEHDDIMDAARYAYMMRRFADAAMNYEMDAYRESQGMEEVSDLGGTTGYE